MMAFGFILFVHSLFLLVPSISSDLVSNLERYGLEDVQKYVKCSDSDELETNECFYREVSYVSCLNMTIRYDTCKNVDIDDEINDVPADSSVKHDWKTLQAFYTRHNGFRRRKMLPDGACVEMDEGRCRLYRCVKKCCLGWKADDTGSCSIRIGNDYCLNGGTYDWQLGFCVCLNRFSGSKCEIPLCDNGCYNNGECIVSKSGKRVCSCPPYTRGEFCEKAICNETCVHGVCVVDGPSTVCLCNNGYYGKTCSHSFNEDSRCPTPYNPVCLNMGCTDQCLSDDECSHGEACCSDGCCNSCAELEDRSCFENGKYYMPGQSFKRDQCTTCLCMINGLLSCSNTTCPTLNCHHTYSDIDDCCPKCTDLSNTVPADLFPKHRAPRIYCTDRIKYVDVKTLDNYAVMKDLNIKAYDFAFHPLAVVYMPDILNHCECNLYSREAVIVEVSATDRYNIVSKCHQKVVVLDSYSPEFLRCPHDIYARVGESVYWKEPIAKDNIGIVSLESNYNRGSSFSSSKMVTYTASDYDSNRAFCSFTVHITNADNQYSYYDDSDTKSSSVEIVVGTLISAFVVIIIAIIMTIIYRRNRIKTRSPVRTNNPRQQNRRHQRPQPGMHDWEVHISTISNATYDNFTPLPPPYSPATNPPSYEEVLQYAQQVNNDNKPPEYENVIAGQTEGIAE